MGRKLPEFTESLFKSVVLSKTIKMISNIHILFKIYYPKIQKLYGDPRVKIHRISVRVFFSESVNIFN